MLNACLYACDNQCACACYTRDWLSCTAMLATCMHAMISEGGDDKAEFGGAACKLQNKLQLAKRQVDQLAKELKALRTQQASKRSFSYIGPARNTQQLASTNRYYCCTGVRRVACGMSLYMLLSDVCHAFTAQ